MGQGGGVGVERGKIPFISLKDGYSTLVLLSHKFATKTLSSSDTIKFNMLDLVYYGLNVISKRLKK